MALVALLNEPKAMVDLLMEPVVEERAPLRIEEGQVLAAALGATLVEYRRYVERRSGANDAGSSGATWRAISRLEQLVRPAHHTVRGRA
jgi:hypothetical protein